MNIIMNSRLELLLSYLKAEPNDAFNLYAVAFEYKSMDVNKAIYYFRLLLSKHADYLGAYYQLGQLLQKDFPVEAENLYTKGIEVAQLQSDGKAEAEITAALNLLKGLEYEDD